MAVGGRDKKLALYALSSDGLRHSRESFGA